MSGSPHVFVQIRFSDKNIVCISCLMCATIPCPSHPHFVFASYCVHCAGLLDVQNILSAETGISRQTEVHSFGDHLISESVSITPSSVIEASIVSL
jgi:hypothetical protein